MRKELIIAALVSIAIFAVYQSSQEAKKDLFEEWKGQFGVNWAPEMESFRRLIFEKNTLKMEKHNADNSQTYKMGINQFTIYTDDEFAARYLTIRPLLGAAMGDTTSAKVIGDVDWTTQGKV